MEFELREWRGGDNESLAKYANNPKIASNLTNQFPHPYTIEHANKFIEMAKSHTPIQVFAITINNEAVGGIGIHSQPDVYCKNMELGYWLAEPFWGNGIISKAILQMVDYGFKTFDINRIFARPYGSNKASQRVLEKSGFELEAHLKNTFFKNGKYLDELIYGISRPT
ncbi:MAG: GNAT family N-acetyltransferase [Salibacteraceae bacterium]